MRAASRFVRAACAAALVALAPGCLGTRSTFGGPGSLGADEIAVVGKVELDPPLHEAEQSDDIATAPYSTQGRLFLSIDDELRPVNTETGPNLVVDTIEAKLGETFEVVVDRSELFVLGGIILLKPSPPIELAEFPGGLRIPLEAGDEAVYVGTIRYHRDRFMKTERIEIVDDYEREAAAFAARHGGALRLQKRLLVPLDDAAPAPGPSTAVAGRRAEPRYR